MSYDPDSARHWSWDEMLKFFRMLGGVCENITLRQGASGRGLFPANAANPILLRVPLDLLFDHNNLEFVGDRLQLKPAANVPDAHRIFFDRYEDAISWGGGGREQSMEFITALDSLPDNVRDVLIADFEFEDLLVGDRITRAQRSFLKSRSIRSGDRSYVMPLIELANHDPAGIPFELGEALRIEGNTHDEILVSYGAHDALSAFRAFGVVSREPGSFSVPLNIPTKPLPIHIDRETNIAVKRGADWLPEMRIAEGQCELSYLMIGHRKLPRLSRGIFRRLMLETGLDSADEAFDSILNHNWTQCLKLLEALEPHEGEMIAALRKAVRYQLESMSCCIGSREPDVDPRSLRRDAESRPAEQAWGMSIQ
jgi:hypothetical protein